MTRHSRSDRAPIQICRQQFRRTSTREKQAEDEPLYFPLVLQEDTGDDKWMDTLGLVLGGGFRAGLMLREDEWVEAMDEDEEMSDLVCDIMTLELGRHPERTSEVLNRREREERVDELPWLVEGVLHCWLQRKFGHVETVVHDLDGKRSAAMIPAMRQR